MCRVPYSVQAVLYNKCATNAYPCCLSTYQIRYPLISPHHRHSTTDQTTRQPDSQAEEQRSSVLATGRNEYHHLEYIAVTHDRHHALRMLDNSILALPRIGFTCTPTTSATKTTQTDRRADKTARRPNHLQCRDLQLLPPTYLLVNSLCPPPPPPFIHYTTTTATITLALAIYTSTPPA